jgi:Uncharacterised nucleotidyltransferase
LPQQPSAGPVENDVLVRCAQKSQDTKDRENLKRLLVQGIDWNLLMRRAEENGLLPLLAEHLRRLNTDLVPEDVRTRLHENERKCAHRTLFLISELIRLVGEFRRKEIPATPYKGPVAASRAFGNPCLRTFNDLDFVVPQRFIVLLSQLMAELGYAARVTSKHFELGEHSAIPGEYVFAHRANGAMVEVHTEFTLRHFPVPPDLDAMLGRSTSISLDGCNVPAFSIEDDLLLLVIHGAKDFWSRLIWVADIAEMIRQSPRLNWRVLFEEARRCKADRMLRLGLFLVQEIFHLTFPEEIGRQIRRDRTVWRIGSEIVRRFEIGVDLPQGVLERSLYRIRMTPRLIDGVRYWTRLSISPAEEDWSTFHNSNPRSHSYAFLRPLRLWRKYGAGVSRS